MKTDQYEAVATEELSNIENGGDGDCSKGVAKRPHHFLHDQPFEERKKAPFSLLDALKSKLPFLEWLPAYRFPDVFSDAVAGVTVGLTVIPQGIAYALLANLPPQYGLYSAFVPCFVYCFLGTCKSLTIGPTAIMAIMTAPHAAKSPAYAVLLAFTSGILITLCGILKLGFLVDFFSIPVIAGFVSAAALTIASNQVRGLLGLTIAEKSRLPGILGTWYDVSANIGTIRWTDAVLGGVCIVVLLMLRRLKTVRWFDPVTDENRSTTSSCNKFCAGLPGKLPKALSGLVWFSSIGRNALVVLSCSVVAYFLGESVFVLTGSIQEGLPPIAPPPFSATYEDAEGNVVQDGLQEMLGNLGSLLVLLPLVSILEHMAIAKAFSGGTPVDASQELLALGMSNLLAAFASSMPATASFGRTAVCAASGARSVLSGVFTGALVLLALALLLPHCAYIPKAALAAVIVCAVIFSVELHVIKPMWRSKRIDLIPYFVTFFGCLFWALDFGIILGIVVSLCILLSHSARHNIKIKVKRLLPSPEGVPPLDLVWISLDRGLVFPSVSYVKSSIWKHVAHLEKSYAQMPVVLDCTSVAELDFTAAEGIRDLLRDFKKQSRVLIIFGLRPENLTVLKNLLQRKTPFLHAECVDELRDLIHHKQ